MQLSCILSAKEQSTYQSILGVLLYISTCTRPDISFTVSVLCRKMKQANKEDMQALTHLLRYMQGSKEAELPLGTKVAGLTGYSDASFADCRQSRRSSAGYLFSFMGGIVSWRSSLQKTVALSTAESEYMSLSAAAQEGIYLRELTTELKLFAFGHNDSGTGVATVQRSDSSKQKVIHSFELATDNQAALSIAEQNSPTSRSKHIAVRYYYLRQLVDTRELTLQYVQSTRQLADIFTKALPADRFRTLMTNILRYSSSD